MAALQSLCFSPYSIWPSAIISLSILTLLSAPMTGHCKLCHRPADDVATHWSSIEVNESHSLYNGLTYTCSKTKCRGREPKSAFCLSHVIHICFCNDMLNKLNKSHWIWQFLIVMLTTFCSLESHPVWTVILDSCNFYTNAIFVMTRDAWGKIQESCNGCVQWRWQTTYILRMLPQCEPNS